MLTHDCSTCSGKGLCPIEAYAPWINDNKSTIEEHVFKVIKERTKRGLKHHKKQSRSNSTTTKINKEETMERKFKVGDKVRINKKIGIISLLCPELQPGVEATVAQLGGATTEEGVVIVNPTFGQGMPSYPEHGIWVDEKHLDLVD